MDLPAPAEDIFNSIGVKPVISATGTVTAYGGSRLRPEVMDAMNRSSNTMVNIDELNVAAGKIIAKYTGAEAGLVTSGAAGGLVLQAAAVIAGSDPIKMKSLPNADSMNNEIIIHRSHRFPYDQCYLSVGARFVEIGDGRRCQPWELEGAFSDKTAAVAYLFSPFLTRRSIPFGEVCEIAHNRGVPVIVDAASYVPPRANLKRFISEGADMVIYSGGKGVRGPQGSGILCGRSDLIEAAYANASPHQFIGRGLKVSKEEIIGLVNSLALFVEEDEQAENKRYQNMCDKVVDAFVELPGLEVRTVHDEYDFLIPMALLTFTRDWKGPSKEEVWNYLANGTPAIYTGNIGEPDDLAVDPFNLTDTELETVIGRLHEILVG
jgi:L-seryl-tRNA(Ser) seleniumtransferase